MIRRRLSLVLASAAALGALAVPAASALEAAPRVAVPASTWGCVGVQQLDLGICVNNPFPQ